MNKTFGLLFYLKKSKVDSQGKAPIYLRFTVDGKRSEVSIKSRIEPNRWDSRANKVKGRTDDVKELNRYLDRAC